MAEAEATSLTFQPGKVGMSQKLGQITKVEEDGQAERLGVKVGMQILSINDEAFSDELMKGKVFGTEDYRVTFAQAAASSASASAEVKNSADPAWAGDSDDDNGNLEQRATDSFVAREQRLTSGAEALNQEAIIGDVDVEVVALDAEWSGGPGSDEEDSPKRLNAHAAGVYQARERRLTAGAEELEKDQVLGDKDVHVLVEAEEWSGAADTDLDESPETVAAAIFEARERRLTTGAEELQKDLVIGDTDVPVFEESKEWAGVAETDLDDEPEQLDEHASEIFQARERRLTTGQEELEKELAIGDTDVFVLAEDKEWAGEADANDEDAPEKLDQHASDVYEARERRLTTGAEELEKMVAGDVVLGDVDVPLLTETKEWAGDVEDDEVVPNIDEHAAEVYEVRERRLTVGAEELEKDMVIGDTDVPVISAATEWAGAAEDDEDEDTTAQPEQIASEAFEARERRLTAGAEELEKEMLLGDAEVEVVKESKDWGGESSDEEDSQVLDKRASEAFAMRERRLTAGAEALELTLADDGLVASSEPAKSAEPSQEFDPPARVNDQADRAEPSGAAPAAAPAASEEAAPAASAAAAGDEEESEWETDSQTDDEIFNRANPERALRRRAERADPWHVMFRWLAGVIKKRLEAEGPEAKRLRALLPPDGLKASTLTTESLCDGKLLCALVIALRPDVIAKPIPNAMGRLAQVQKACKQLGVREADIFVSADIITPPPQNPKAVLRCLTGLAALAQAWPDYAGPKLAKCR